MATFIESLAQNRIGDSLRLANQPANPRLGSASAIKRCWLQRDVCEAMVKDACDVGGIIQRAAGEEPCHKCRGVVMVGFGAA